MKELILTPNNERGIKLNCKAASTVILEALENFVEVG